MTQYRYQLDKTSKKFNCPQCGKKRFVKYVDVENDNYADSNYGRCDRESSCGYLAYPTNEIKMNYKYVEAPPIKATYINKELRDKSLNKYEINPLVTYLISNGYSRDVVEPTLLKYHVGTSNMFNGSTVFWQTDHTGNIRTGKIMAYDTVTGKRIKDKASITWVHCIVDIPNFNLKQCLFGLHLINNKQKRIAVVESEKTALIMSLEFPSEIWMATGSLQGFKYDYLLPLKNYEVIAFPDKGGFHKWNKVAQELNSLGFDIRVSKYLERLEFDDGWDLVDVIEYDA